jgi:YVTN family beta-propeller protein
MRCFMAFSPMWCFGHAAIAGSRVYVANSGSNNVSVIDTKTNMVASISVGAVPVAYGIFIQPERSRTFAGTPGAANCASNSLSACLTSTVASPRRRPRLTYSSVVDLENAILAYCSG